jgi:hypothetical protein
MEKNDRSKKRKRSEDAPAATTPPKATLHCSKKYIPVQFPVPAGFNTARSVVRVHSDHYLKGNHKIDPPPDPPGTDLVRFLCARLFRIISQDVEVPTNQQFFNFIHLNKQKERKRKTNMEK